MFSLFRYSSNNEKLFYLFQLERLYIYSCRYNYRSDHCMYMSVCKDANKNGVAVIHGSRSTFHGDKQPAFKAIYSSMEEVRSLRRGEENRAFSPEIGYFTHTDKTVARAVKGCPQ